MNETIVLILIIFAVYVILVLLLAGIMKIARRRAEARQKRMVLAIRVAKTNEMGPIVAEQIFAAFHGFYRHISLWKRLMGRQQPKLSFEIANTGRNIFFYLTFPRHWKNFIEGQIYAQYPNAEIDEIQDYTNVLGSASYAAGAQLNSEDPVIYPIKRYPQFEDKLTRVPIDPMAGLTATLSKLSSSQDFAAIQIVIRPLYPEIRIMYLKCLRIITKGVFGNIETLKKFYIRLFITRNWVLKAILFPLYFWFWIRGITSGMKHSPLSMTVEKEKEDSLREEMSRAHERETDIDAAMDKISKLLFEASVRIIYVPKETDREVAVVKVREIAGAFKQFNIPHLNGFKMKEIEEGRWILESFRSRECDGRLVLNNEELATIFHLPHTNVATPNIVWVRSRKLEPPSDLPIPTAGDEGFTMLGKTNFRGSSQEFGIRTSDRRRHMYIIGKTGMGKSTLLENMIFSDIRSGKGVAVVDPHGDLADRVLDFVPSNRTNDVILFDPSDRDFPVAFNMLENIDPTYNTIVASGLVGIFKKIYAESWGPRLEHILRNTILGLLEYPNTTMLGITRILQDADFRHRVVKKIADPVVKSFWVNEFERMEPRMRSEAISPILNKVGQFLSSPIIRNIVGQPKSSVNLRFAMDNKKIVIVNLSKGKIGEDNSSLLGAMIITKFQLDAMSRADIPEKDRVDFYLYVDEFQNFATESFATILSEARKYKLNLTMANQYIEQMAEEVRYAVFGNVGTLVSFQVGFDDAEPIAGQFGGDEDETMVADLTSLQVGNTYIRLLVDGMPTPVFSMTTFRAPQFEVEAGRRDKILKFCRERYSVNRDVVEDKIKRWSESAQAEIEKKEEKKLPKESEKESKQ